MNEETKKFESLTSPSDLKMNSGLGGQNAEDNAVIETKIKEDALKLPDWAKKFIGGLRVAPKTWDQAAEEEIRRHAEERKQQGRAVTDIGEALRLFTNIDRNLAKLVALGSPAYVVDPTGRTVNGYPAYTVRPEAPVGPVGPAFVPPAPTHDLRAAPEPTETASSGHPPLEGALFDRTYSGGSVGGWATTQQSPPPTPAIDRESCPFCGAPLRVRSGEEEDWGIFCPTIECPVGNGFRDREDAEKALRLRPIDFKVLEDGRRVLK